MSINVSECIYANGTVIMRASFAVSPELADGIARVHAERTAEIEALGGYGSRITGKNRMGQVLTGVLAPAATLDQRPVLVTDSGRRYVLETYTRA